MITSAPSCVFSILRPHIGWLVPDMAAILLWMSECVCE